MIENLIWITFCVYFEAMGEPFEGQKAVAHSIINRVKKRKISAKAVVLQPYQYSWANGDNRPPIKDYKAFTSCAKATYDALDEQLNGITNADADHYFNPHKVQPDWDFSKLKYVGKIGNHAFYKHL